MLLRISEQKKYTITPLLVNKVLDTQARAKKEKQSLTFNRALIETFKCLGIIGFVLLAIGIFLGLLYLSLTL